MIITVFPYHWRWLDFSKRHLQGYSFLWFFGRAEPLFDSSGSSGLSRSTYRECRVEFRECSGGIRGGRGRAGGSLSPQLRLTGLGLVPPLGPPVAAVILAGGIIIQYGGGGSSSPSGSCKIPSSSLIILGHQDFSSPTMGEKTGPFGGVLGHSQPRGYVRKLVGVSGLSCNYSVDCLYVIEVHSSLWRPANPH